MYMYIYIHVCVCVCMFWQPEIRQRPFPPMTCPSFSIKTYPKQLVAKLFTDLVKGSRQLSQLDAW